MTAKQSQTSLTIQIVPLNFQRYEIAPPGAKFYEIKGFVYQMSKICGILNIQIDVTQLFYL